MQESENEVTKLSCEKNAFKSPGVSIHLSSLQTKILDEQFHIITKTYLYNFDPFRPHFYIVKLGFTGVYITKTRLFKYIENVSSKNLKFSDKKL